MRVIAGSAKSRRLQCPKGADLRPTTDMVREALFNSLGDRTIDCQFGDLYAGSGSVGIEALSRGAAHCLFIERNRQCLQALRANLESTGLEDRAMVVAGDCLKRLPELWQAAPLDIAFIDPPYRDSTEGALRLVMQLSDETHTDCLAVVQCARGGEPSIDPDREKRYGETMLLYYEIRRAGGLNPR